MYVFREVMSKDEKLCFLFLMSENWMGVYKAYGYSLRMWFFIFLARGSLRAFYHRRKYRDFQRKFDLTTSYTQR
jgi:hypothetical protein